MKKDRQDDKRMLRERGSDAIERRAALWAVRQADPAFGERQRQALRRWLDRDPAHAAAFAALRETWAGLEAEKPLPVSQPLPAGSRPAGPPSSASPPRSAPRAPRLSWPAWAALAACLLVVSLVGLRYGGDLLLALTADHRSGYGERLALVLPDGSRAELNGNSAIALDFDPVGTAGGQRRVRLLRGEAWFQPAPLGDGEPRPFLVETAGGSSRALGTAFLVRRGLGGDSQAVLVTVQEHQVAVTAPDGNAQHLSAGEAIRYDGEGLGPILPAPEAALAWREGLLVFDRVPLSEALDELNRYRRVPVSLGDTAFGNRLVSGVFRLDALDAAVEAIARELDLSVLEIPLVTTLLY